MIHLSRSSVSLDSTIHIAAAGVVVAVGNVDGQLDSPFGFNCWQAEPEVGVVEADSGPDCLGVGVDHLHHLLHLRLLLGDVQGGGGKGLGQCEVKRGVLNSSVNSLSSVTLTP